MTKTVKIGLVPEPSNPYITQCVVDILAPITQSRADMIRDTIGEVGPGIDIVIHPTVPLSSAWLLEPVSPAGKKFRELFWLGNPRNSSELIEFKRQAADWGLSFHTDWGIE
jgi:hypothetical protein